MNNFVAGSKNVNRHLIQINEGLNPAAYTSCALMNSYSSGGNRYAKPAPGPVHDKREKGIYLNQPRQLTGFNRGMTTAVSQLSGSHLQVRCAHTDTMPRLYRKMPNAHRLKDDPQYFKPKVDMLKYSMLMAAGGSVFFMGKEVLGGLADYFGPDASIQAASVATVDISGIAEGDFIKMQYQGKQLIIRHRTDSDILEAQQESLRNLIHPEEDSQRFRNPKWLIVEAVCPHLGCIPLVGQGEYDGFFCPCHGSHFDKSGRIRKGPSPTNLRVPKHSFMDENTLVVGAE